MAYLESIKTFVRVYELGSMAAAGRDLRISTALTSTRVASLEERLGVRLFHRTTRSMTPTEQGAAFYDDSLDVLRALENAEARISNMTGNPAGSIFVAAPLGMGRRFIAPKVGEFCDAYPDVVIRLRLSDRKTDVLAEGIDLAFILGNPEDSSMTMRKIQDLNRVLCASPDYVGARGMPADGHDLVADKHQCLNLRFPGATEFQWTLVTPDGPKRFRIGGRLEADDGDVLTQWALEGRGIVMKPMFEVHEHLASGALVPVAEETPPIPVQLACLFPHRHLQAPKVRMFMDFMVEDLEESIRAACGDPMSG